MGKTMMGGVSHEGNVNLLTPEQMGYLSQALQGTSDMSQPMSPEQLQGLFQKSFVDPAQQMMQRQIIPGIKEQFMGLDESGSSALNQALSQSATDLSTSLGSQLMNQYNLGQNRRLQSLGLMGQLSGQKTFTPMIHEQQGILGDIISALGQVMAAGSSSPIPMF